MERICGHWLMVWLPKFAAREGPCYVPSDIPAEGYHVIQNSADTVEKKKKETDYPPIFPPINQEPKPVESRYCYSDFEVLVSWFPDLSSKFVSSQKVTTGETLSNPYRAASL